MKLQPFITLAILGCTSSVLAADYSFSVEGESGRVQIKLAKPATEFRMPAWAPGDYELLNYGKRLEQVVFKKGNENVEATQGSDPNLWTIPEGATSVSYLVKPSRGNFSPNLQIRSTDVFISGPGVFGYFVGHTDQPHTLVLPQKAQTPLAKGDKYVARDYDHLIDSPIVYGTSVRTLEQSLHGKRHVVVAFGKSENADLDSFMKVGLAAAEQGYKMFGEFGYEQYYFMFDMGGPGGGLEHGESARMGINPNSNGPQNTGLIFHEYIHNYNVKRIRAKVLGPFDYSQPARTGSLWWLEGVTDYYADVFEVRAGITSREDALRSINFVAQGVEGNSYTKISVHEASMKVWDTRGSWGYQNVNYYSKGKAAGLLLDFAIRGYSNGKYSLDNVMKKLWEETKGGKPGYSETRIRELCVEFGGPELGQIYDQAIMAPSPMPWDKVLPKVGLKLDSRALVEDDSQPEVARKLGRAWPTVK